MDHQIYNTIPPTRDKEDNSIIYYEYAIKKPENVVDTSVKLLNPDCITDANVYIKIADENVEH